jgi:rubrerythrin
MEKDIIKPLKAALANEIAGEEFYTKVAKEAKDDFTIKTFQHLAGEEKAHIEKIKEFIKGKQSVEIERKIRERNPKSGFLFFQMNEEQFRRQKKASESSKFNPYEFAVKMEEKSYSQYKSMYNKAKGGNVRDFLLFLMKEEDTHRKLLLESLNFLRNPEDYYLEREGWSFD